ncbi:MAG: hypothetical protein Pg6A_20160 [Termitinemataceae bacterium]|nr:MAG: hypothetical protein Pg6A_20160 [Termitinemataceae bacterium]
MWKFIKQLWAIKYERAKVHKAVRLLSKQEWSVEFLVWLVKTAALKSKSPIRLVIKNGINTLEINSIKDEGDKRLVTEDVFDILEDDMKLEAALTAIGRSSV